MTTEVDESIMERPRGSIIAWLPKQPADYLMKLLSSGKANYVQRVQDNEPGTRLQDVALHQAASSFWWAGTKMNGENPKGSIMELVNLSRNAIGVSPSDFNVGPWTGTPEEASEMVEAAGIFLGAAQIGFTSVNENWLPANVVFDSSVNQVTRTEDKQVLYPEGFRYVVTGQVLVPVPSGIRSPTAIGAAADRLGFEHAWLSMTRIINFLTCLGYGAEVIPSINPVPWTVAAGLGEIGRMNRVDLGGRRIIKKRFAIIPAGILPALQKMRPGLSFRCAQSGGRAELGMGRRAALALSRQESLVGEFPEVP
jgi:hypothetical protein